MRYCVAAVISLCFGLQARGYALFAGFDFNDGARWELVCVSLHNYALTPQQSVYKTFVVRDVPTLKTAQQLWDFPLMFRDVCDYHYALKLYRDGELVKSLLLNLRCNYITVGAFSYSFDPNLFEALAQQRTPLPWSRVWFTELPRIQLALARLAADPTVYFYHDVQPYRYDGYFLYATAGLPIRTNRDSLLKAVPRQVAQAAGQPLDSVYAQPHLFTLEDDNTLDFRYRVYCSRATYEAFRAAQPQHVRVSWRGHFEFDPKLPIVVVGINEEKYYRLLRQ
ncbi:MAG: hypothetical protein SFY70_08475 [Bacteroidia bacterium]|nr:hypothetical protein [Bacteroidia bacterium]